MRLIKRFWKNCLAATLAIALFGGGSSVSAAPQQLTPQQRQALMQLLQKQQNQLNQLNSEANRLKQLRASQQQMQQISRLTAELVRQMHSTRLTLNNAR